LDSSSLFCGQKFRFNEKQELKSHLIIKHRNWKNANNQRTEEQLKAIFADQSVIETELDANKRCNALNIKIHEIIDKEAKWEKIKVKMRGN
jgi:hypothetical protein